MKTIAYPSLILSALLSQSILTPAGAHEARELTASKNWVDLTVGFSNEPAFEDTFNGVDVILAVDDGDCPAAPAGVDIRHAGAQHITAPIDTNAGDTVNLQVEALYLNTAVRPTGAGGNSLLPLANILKRLTITTAYPLKGKWGAAGTYNSYFRPTNPGPGTGANSGAYAFHIFGNVSATAKSSTSCGGPAKSMAARTAKINSYFVCGPNGTMSVSGSYNCVKTIQPFPGTAQEGYQPSRKF